MLCFLQFFIAQVACCVMRAGHLANNPNYSLLFGEMSMENKDMLAMNRRGFFHSVGSVGVAAAVVGGGVFVGSPRDASAAVDALIAEHVGPGTITMDKVVVDTPDKAENGAMVRIPVVVNHPMEP
ncbi:MAG TPA: hypothetical protein DCS88_12835, partial [Alphaproteobacteria bacterium]|nr:hypothetical protein [Alphaproteobacteria bacterium]